MRASSQKYSSLEHKNRSILNKAPTHFTNRDILQSKDPNKQDPTRINDQLRWLENIVSGFEHYRFQKNDLFINNTQESLEKAKNASTKFVKNFHIVRLSPKKSKATPLEPSKLMSNRTVNQNVPVNNPKSQMNKTKKRNPVSIQKDKTAVAKVKNNGSSTLKKENEKENQQKVKNGLTANQIQICGINIDSSGKKKDQFKPKPVENKNKLTYGRKAAQIKAARKNLMQSAMTGNMKSVGKIVRNKSVENQTMPAKKKSQYVDFLMIPEVLTEQTDTRHQIKPQEILFPKKSNDSNLRNSKEDIDPRETLKQQLEFKKYQYYIENIRPSKTQKKQRKLNSSFGENSKVRHQNSFSTARLTSNNNPSVEKMRYHTLDKAPSPEKNQLCVSYLCDETKNSSYSQQKEKQFAPSNQDYKLATSLKNSNESVNRNQLTVGDAKNDSQTGNDWNIIQIFHRLDSRHSGVLTSSNCSIQSLSRQIRYIMGPILEEILYKGTKFTLETFIVRAGEILDRIKDNNLEQDLRNFMEVKEYAPKTDREWKFCQNQRLSITQPEISQNIDQRDIIEAVSYGNTQMSSQISIISKKYEFQSQQKEPVGDILKKLKLLEKDQYEPNIQKNTQKSNIRFATFQNEEDDEIKTPKTDQWKQQLNLEKKLERQLEPLNDFKAPSELTFNNNDKKTNPITQPGQDCQDMAKLQILNKRLQKYLIQQSIKGMSNQSGLSSF